MPQFLADPVGVPAVHLRHGPNEREQCQRDEAEHDRRAQAARDEHEVGDRDERQREDRASALAEQIQHGVAGRRDRWQALAPEQAAKGATRARSSATPSS